MFPNRIKTENNLKMKIQKFNGRYSLTNYTNSAPVLPWGLGLLFIICLLVSAPAKANPNNLNTSPSTYYQEALDLLCPSVEKLARSLYTYADWGVGYNTAIVHVRKRFFKVIPETTSSEVVAQIEAELENEVEYILISHNEKRGINEVINTTTESCYSTFDKNI